MPHIIAKNDCFQELADLLNNSEKGKPDITFDGKMLVSFSKASGILNVSYQGRIRASLFKTMPGSDKRVYRFLQDDQHSIRPLFSTEIIIAGKWTTGVDEPGLGRIHVYGQSELVIPEGHGVREYQDPLTIKLYINNAF